MRRTGCPSVVSGAGNHHLLSRVEFSDRSLAEEFLQDSLNKSPQIVPVEDIDPAFAPLVSLGREIDSIDNLFISPNGKITLVETKLWRNPEAAREVVAQVLDYAARLSSWSYTDLENAARKAMTPAPIGSSSLYAFMAKKYPAEILPEEQFVDEVQKNLQSARFLLLVVGDGIRENLENMLGILHKQPQMLYTFGLVEIHIYENPALFEGRLLMPMLVAKTTEIVRAVVRVQTSGQAQVSVTLDDTAKDDAQEGTRRRTLSEDIFFSEIEDEKTKQLFRRLIAFAQDIGAELKWGSSSVSIQLPDPKGSKQNLTLFVMNTLSQTYIGWLADQLDRVSLDKNIALEYAKSLAAMFLNMGVTKKCPDVLTRAITSAELESKTEEFMNLVRETVRKIVGEN